ncbi:hypothetical protein DL93DRAFT_2232656 [Clavulina sp. PMI_390]|nr:hypothetical protein DL93DRAFT_2232656 [Clavulina sp. PMI_390]
MAAHPLSTSSGAQQANSSYRILGDEKHGRILCLADVRGRLSTLNELAVETGAVAIIHTGDFGFFDRSSLDRINDRTLRHLILYSPLIANSERDELLADSTSISNLRASIANSPTPLLSEFPQLLTGDIKLSVPVFTVWGACEDVTILEKFRNSEYQIDNLHILDEATSQALDIGGIKLRLLGLGGALVPHKLFDNGDGRATIAGGQGTMWATALQIGELVDTAQRSYDQSETRLFISHASPGREGIIAQLALVLKADLTISAGLHFRYASSYNEFSVQNDMDGFRQKLVSGRENFNRVWENVKGQVEAVIDDNQRILLEKCLSVVERVPAAQPSGNTAEEPAWKNCWNWNLCDAAYGHLVLEIREGRVSSELKSQGFNYAYRRKTPAPAESTAPPSSQAQVAGAIPPTNGASTSPGSPAPESPGPDGRKRLSKANQPKKPTDDTPLTDAESSLAPASSKAAPRSLAASPAPSASAGRADLVSPTDSTGARTPLTARPKRNPWTLFVNSLPVPVTEDEIRDFFGPSASNITHIKIPINFHSKQQKAVAFVEFGDKDAMDEALAKHNETIGETHPKVAIATDNTESPKPAGRGSGRGGRGGYRGGFGATRGGRHDGGDSGARKPDANQAGDWGASWTKTTVETTSIAYGLQIHQVSNGVVVQLFQRDVKVSPARWQVTPGTPLALLPAFLPSYYLGTMKNKAKPPPELTSSLEGHGYYSPSSDELFVCWVPLRKSPTSDSISDEGMCFVWPRSMCTISSTRDVKATLPPFDTVNFPTVKTLAPLARVWTPRLRKPFTLRASNASDLSRAAQRASIFVEAAVQDRERARDQRSSRFTSPSSIGSSPRNVITSHQSQFHPLYPSPPGASPENILLDSFFAPQLPAETVSNGSNIHSPTSVVINSDFLGDSQFPAQATDHGTFNFAAPAQRISSADDWLAGFDPTVDGLDDFSLTDDVFSYFDSPPAAANIRSLAEIAKRPSSGTATPTTSIPPPPPLPIVSEVVSPTPSPDSLSIESMSPVAVAEPREGFSAIPLDGKSWHNPFDWMLYSTSLRTPALFMDQYTTASDPRQETLSKLRALRLNDNSSTPSHSVVLEDEVGTNDSSSEGTDAHITVDREIFLPPSTLLQDDPPLSPLQPPSPLPESTPFALLTQRTFDVGWLPQVSYQVASSVPTPQAFSISQVTKSYQAPMHLLSVPTPVSPSEGARDSEREESLRAILPFLVSSSLESEISNKKPSCITPNIRAEIEHSVTSLLDSTADFSSVIQLPISQPAREPASRSRAQGKSLMETLDHPRLVLGSNGNIVHVAPTAVRFWRSLGLSPLHGSKDVTAALFFEPEHVRHEVAESWLARVGHAYQGHGFGSHTGGDSGLRAGGIISLRWSNFQRTLENVVTAVGGEVRLVIYLIFSEESFFRSPAEYGQIIETLHQYTGPIFQFVPASFLGAEACDESRISRFVTMLYNRIPLQVQRVIPRVEFEDVGDVATWIDGPAFTVTNPRPPTFRFALDFTTAGIEPIDRLVRLHVGYTYSEDRKWIFVSIIDQRGESWRNKVLEIAALGGGGDRETRIAEALWRMILAFTRRVNTEWAIVVCKLGRLTPRETKAWENCIGRTDDNDECAQHFLLLEACESLSFPTPPVPGGATPAINTASDSAPPSPIVSSGTPASSKGGGQLVITEPPPASAVYSHLRLALPDPRALPSREDAQWPDGDPPDQDAAVCLPLTTAFLIPRPPGSPTQPPGSQLPLVEALQVNTMFVWTSRTSTLNIWGRSILEVQRDWMSNFNDLASLAHARFQNPSLPWWPYHVLAVDMMAKAADRIISRIQS